MSAADKLADALRVACDVWPALPIDHPQAMGFATARAALAEYDAERQQQAREQAGLAAALRRLMNYVGGWDEKPTHPCGIGRDALAAYDAEHPGQAIPGAISTVEALEAVADDYVGDRLEDWGTGDTSRDSLDELVNEAIGHAASVLGIDLQLPRDEEIHDAIAENITDRHTTVSDESRSNGPRL